MFNFNKNRQVIPSECDAETDRRASSTNKEAMQAAGDARLMEEFISRHRSFIRAAAARAAGRFITESDDEYMIAMEAFHEAILKYEPERGDFMAFAGVVIKRRLVDQYRRQQKFSAEVAADGFVMDGGAGAMDEDADTDPMTFRIRRQVAAAGANQDRENLLEEIAALQQSLQKYGFGFKEMKDAAPKAGKTQDICREAVCLILREGLLPRIRKERHLPMGEICGRLRISSKKLERHRKYIIAVCEILDGEYPYLSEFLGETRDRLRQTDAGLKASER